MFGASKLDHLQPMKPLLFPNFLQLFHLHTVRPILITSEGQSLKIRIIPTPKMEETEGFQCLGHSNWTICIPLNPCCSENFPYVSLSYWEDNSYYPRGPIIENKNYSNPKNGGDRGFSVPRAFKLDPLHPFKPLLF